MRWRLALADRAASALFVLSVLAAVLADGGAYALFAASALAAEGVLRYSIIYVYCSGTPGEPGSRPQRAQPLLNGVLPRTLGNSLKSQIYEEFLFSQKYQVSRESKQTTPLGVSATGPTSGPQRRPHTLLGEILDSGFIYLLYLDVCCMG